MKAIVKIAYTDKNDGVVHLVGEEVELTDARHKELAANGYVEACKAAPKTVQPKPKAEMPKPKKAE